MVPSSLPSSGRDLLLDFDRGIRADPTGRHYLEDASGKGHTAFVEARNGGDVATVPRDHGVALQLPGRCIEDAITTCPRAYLQIPSADDLNPGSRDFSFGSDILLTAAQAKLGSDIVRKGYGRGVDVTGQWRLQLEEDGRPSCAVTGKGMSESFVVESSDSIANSVWHRIRCTRSGSTLTIQVDDSTGKTIAIPDGLLVETPEDVLVGGGGDEQFFGALDNVDFSSS